MQYNIPINDGWKFVRLPDFEIKNAGKIHVDDAKCEEVNLPHTLYSDENPYRGLVCYRRMLKLDLDWKHAFIDVPAADQHAVVFVNGEKIVEHKGGYSAFRGEIPEKFLRDPEVSEVLLEIFVTNVLNEEISPLTGDFTIFGGLYRGVNLLATCNDSYFDPKYYGTDGVILRSSVEGRKKNTGRMEAEIHGYFESEDSVVLEVLDADGNKVSVKEESVCKGNHSLEMCAETFISTDVPEPHLWNGKKDPYLYTVKVRLLHDGNIVDEKILKTGFKKVSIDSDKGLFLNDRHVRVKGVAKHQDFQDKFNRVSDEEIDRDFELIDEIGANAVRLSHYQHPQHTYEVTDEKGYLVWAEIPMLKMTENQRLFENAEEQLKELVLQNIHHPSIFCWGIQNEIGMFRDSKFMYEELGKLRDIAKALDPSRLVTGANLYTVKFKSGLNSGLDMVGYNVYFGWYYGKMQDYDEYLDKFHAGRPEVPIGISEYGVDANISLHSEEPMIRDYSEEYQALYHETVYPIFESKDYLWGSFVWNMFDFSSSLRKEGGQVNLNAKGLVTYDRKNRKDAFYYYKAKWSENKFLHVCSKRFEKRAKEAIDIKVYTNCDSVHLSVNGSEIGTEKNNGNGTVLFKNVFLSMGKNEVEAVSADASGGQTNNRVEAVPEKAYQNEKIYSDSVEASTMVKDRCIIERVPEEEKSYRLPDSGAGSAVKNWFLSDDDTVREGYCSIKDSANDLLENSEAKVVLEKHLPELVKFMLTKDVIPLGLSLESILSRNTPEGLDIKKLNKDLNEIPALM